MVKRDSRQVAQDRYLLKGAIIKVILTNNTRPADLPISLIKQKRQFERFLCIND